MNKEDETMQANNKPAVSPEQGRSRIITRKIPGRCSPSKPLAKTQAQQTPLTLLESVLSTQGMNLKDLFNTGFSGYKNDQTLIQIFQDAYQDEYPEAAKPYGYLAKTKLQWIAEALGGGMGHSIVDVGCGHGGPGLWVAKQIGAKLVGVDISEVAIGIANQRVHEFGLDGKAQFQIGDFYMTGLPSDHYNGAMSIDALVFVPEVMCALQEISRILKKGTCFVFTTWELHQAESAESYSSYLEKSGFEVLDTPS